MSGAMPSNLSEQIISYFTKTVDSYTEKSHINIKENKINFELIFL